VLAVLLGEVEREMMTRMTRQAAGVAGRSAWHQDGGRTEVDAARVPRAFRRKPADACPFQGCGILSERSSGNAVHVRGGRHKKCYRKTPEE
jgi:hypothetical protein